MGVALQGGLMCGNGVFHLRLKFAVCLSETFQVFLRTANVLSLLGDYENILLKS